MAVNEYYIVNFADAFALFQHRVAHDDIPTIDLDQVKCQVLAMFEHIEPLTQLGRFADEMVRHDWLYDKVEFVNTTFEESVRKRVELNQYLHAGIMELGHNLYAKLKEVGMLARGTERYRVTIRPLDNETYTLQQTRS